MNKHGLVTIRSAPLILELGNRDLELVFNGANYGAGCLSDVGS